MPRTTSLEEIFRNAVTFPGAGVAVSALQTALGHLEEELERSAAQISVRLSAKHSSLGEELHPEDKEQDEYELDRTVNVLLPRVVRGGFVLTLWSTFETAALDLAQYAARELHIAIPIDPFKHGSFLVNLDKVFTKTLKIAAFPDPAEHDRLDELRLFRHTLIHHGGKVVNLPVTLQRSNSQEYASIGLYLYEDMRHSYVVPDADFTRRRLELVSEYLLALSRRLYEAIHPVPLN